MVWSGSGFRVQGLGLRVHRDGGLGVWGLNSGQDCNLDGVLERAIWEQSFG